MTHSVQTIAVVAFYMAGILRGGAWPGLGSVQIAAPSYTCTTSAPGHQQLVGRTGVCWEDAMQGLWTTLKPTSTTGAGGQPGRIRSR